MQHRGYRHPFLVGTHYLGGVGDNPRTLHDMAMSQFSYSMRTESEWWKSYRDAETREAWTIDAASRIWKVKTPRGEVDVRLSAKQVEYTIDELEGYAYLRDAVSNCQVSCFERIWESHTLLPNSTLPSLNTELDKLRHESTTHSEILVDPHLHPLIYGKTLARQAHLTMPQPVLHDAMTDIYTVSPDLCLIPTDVQISPSGQATFAAYINNLDPMKYGGLYAQLEELLTRFIPLFEKTLTDLHRNNPLKARISGACRYTIWDEPEEPEYSDDDEGWTNYERDMRHWILNRPIALPDVPDKYPGTHHYRKHRVSLRGRDVQVLIRISHINLKSGDPPRPASPWHVEGMRNERIAACGIYYTSIENICAHSLSFRMAVTSPRFFAAGDAGAVFRTWGFNDGDPCFQYINSVPLTSTSPSCHSSTPSALDSSGNIGITFPNIYQQSHTPLSLADPTRPGHLTTIEFLLVDPDVEPRVGTAKVPPQQADWVRDALVDSLVFFDARDEDGDTELDATLNGLTIGDECESTTGTLNGAGVVKKKTVIRPRLPIEVIDLIMDSGVDGLVSSDEAEVTRRKVEREREVFRELNDMYHFCVPFDIWNGPQLLH